MKMDDLDLQIKYTPAERQFLLYEYFQKHTNKEHPVSRKEILDYLETFEIYISPHTLYSDLDVLRGTMKLDIQFNAHAHKGAGGYWVKNPKFEPYELRLMVDGIQSSKFIPQKEAKELSDKIKKLASRNERILLERRNYVANRVRSLNDSVFYHIDDIHSAIADGWKLSFHYFTYDLQKKKRYFKEHYIVSPYALIWNDDNYYLLAYHAGMMKHFRVDKIDDIKIVKERREGVEAFKTLKLTERSLKVFSMYGGTEETITLRFSNHLIGVVLDRFGRDIRISPDDDRHFKITVKVEVSPQFYGWLCGLGTGVRIIHPDEVAQKMGEYVRSIAKMY